MLPIRTATLAFAAALAVSAAPGFAQTTSMSASGPMAGSASMGSSSVGAGDKSFVMNAAIGGMTEVALGKIAATKGSSPGVKDYGSKMVDDHTKANDELKSLATPKGLTPPPTPDAMHQRVVDKFDKMAAGPAFDKAYHDQMVADHKKTIALFQKEAKSGKDADLKGFADKTLPTLKDHLQMLQSMKSM